MDWVWFVIFVVIAIAVFLLAVLGANSKPKLEDEKPRGRAKLATLDETLAAARGDSPICRGRRTVTKTERRSWHQPPIRPRPRRKRRAATARIAASISVAFLTKQKAIGSLG